MIDLFFGLSIIVLRKKILYGWIELRLEPVCSTVFFHEILSYTEINSLLAVWFGGAGGCEGGEV